MMMTLQQVASPSAQQLWQPAEKHAASLNVIRRTPAATTASSSPLSSPSTPVFFIIVLVLSLLSKLTLVSLTDALRNHIFQNNSIKDPSWKDHPKDNESAVSMIILAALAGDGGA